MVSPLSRGGDERRVDGVAVTRHLMFVIPSVLVDTVDENRKRHCPREIVFDHATPASTQFGLNRLAPRNDRYHVCVVVSVEQRETVAVIEPTIKIDGLDLRVKAVEERQELAEKIVGGLASSQLADRQCVSLVANTHVESGIGVKCRGTSFRLREVEVLCFVFVAVVGIKVEVGDDLHRPIWKHLKHIPLEEGIADRFDGVKIELLDEVSTDGIGVG